MNVLFLQFVVWTLAGWIRRPMPMNGQGPVKRRERLGGTLNFYYRQAA